MTYVDLNCDCGECLPGVDEKTILSLVTSCNIACGGHAGNKDSMVQTVQWAMNNRLAIGAHPSYPDPGAFGRRSLKLSKAAFQSSIKSQIDALAEVLQLQGAELAHIKAHGALYHDLNQNQTLTSQYLEALEEYLKDTAIMTMPGSILEAEALKLGYTVIREAFADRKYLDQSRLMKRGQKGAVIEQPFEVLAQIKSMAIDGKVTTFSGENVAIKADSYCLHSDHIGTLQILRYLREHLEGESIKLKVR